MSVYSISISLIAVGTALDNLLFAGLYGKTFQLTKNVNCTESLKWLHLTGTVCFASGLLLLIFYN